MKGRIIKWGIIIILLVVGVASFVLWRRVDSQVKRLLLPNVPQYAGYSDLPEKTQGVRLTPFEITGWDGKPLQACVVSQAPQEEDLTPRQHALLDRLRTTELEDLSAIDYALVSVNWDHGIRSALPLAEQLAAAGITCVLWEPRGSNSARPWCTHGLQESKDIPLLINELEKMSNKKRLLLVGVGQGFGAQLLLQAAAKEPRLRATVALDPAASLNKSLKRAHISTPMRELIGRRMNQLTGLEPFDIAAAKSAALIPREAPIMLMYTGSAQNNSVLDDAIAIYTQLQSDRKRMVTLRTPGDAPAATTRSIIYSPEGGTHEVAQSVDVELMPDAEEVPVDILRWLNSCVRPLMEEPAPTILPTHPS